EIDAIEFLRLWPLIHMVPTAQAPASRSEKKPGLYALMSHLSILHRFRGGGLVLDAPSGAVLIPNTSHTLGFSRVVSASICRSRLSREPIVNYERQTSAVWLISIDLPSATRHLT